MAIGLGSLPYELRSQIANDLQCSDLARLSEASHSLQASFQCLAFRDLEQPRFPDGSPRWLNVREMLRILLDRPELGPHVRSLKIHQWGTKTVDIEGARNPDLNKPITRLKEAIWASADNMEEGESLIREETEGHRDLVLLLALMPNLRSLYLDFPSKESDKPIAKLGTILHQARQSSHPHRLRLDSLTMFHAEDLDGSQDIVRFLELPNLREFRGHHFFIDWPTPLTAVIDFPQLSLQHINLQCSMLTDRRMGEVVEACKSLRTFRLLAERNSRQQPCHLDLDILSRAFQAHKSSLESLSINFRPARVEVWPRFAQGQFDLQDFTQLKHVGLPLWSWTNGRDPHGQMQRDCYICSSFVSVSHRPLAELLPASLESLRVFDCHKPTAASMQELRQLAIQPDLKFKALRAINCTPSFYYTFSDKRLPGTAVDLKFLA